MCKWKSGEVVLRGEGECDVYTLEGDDSHNNIREYYHIPEATGGRRDRLHAPAECVPTRGCETEAQFDFRWDGEKPEWATPEIEAKAKHLLFMAAQADKRLTVWKGDLYVYGKAELPALTSVDDKPYKKQ